MRRDSRYLARMFRDSFRMFFVLVTLALVAAPATAESAPASSTTSAPTIAKIHKDAMVVLQAPLRPKVHAAARTLLDRMGAPLPPKSKPRDVLATARQVVVEQNYLGLATRKPANIDTAVLLVLLEASQENEQQLARVRSERAVIAALKACKGDAQCLSQVEPTAPMTKAEAEALRAQLKAKADSLDALEKKDMFLLQQMMELKAQLEAMISEVMKAGYDAGTAATQALKAS